MMTILAKRKLSLEYESIDLARRSSEDYEVSLLFNRLSNANVISAESPPLGPMMLPIILQCECTPLLIIYPLNQ
jgi:hypothetical protein